jgi:hypothetical protein
MFGGEDPTQEQLEEGTEVDCRLTLNGVDYFQLPFYTYRDLEIYRLTTPIAEVEHWEREGSDEEDPEEDEDVRIKRETDEEAGMEKSLRPGTKIYISTSPLVKSGEIQVQFSIEEHVVNTVGIYKGHNRIGVEIPDLGELTVSTEVTIEASLNG